jgi:UDP-N-acetylmuramyl pentapeptide phosphotransferase/UDP-N-acetylglucosamine-1-phosphate transferase
MISLASAFFASFISALLIIRLNHLHSKFSGDHDLLGPQKFHMGSIPRIGGISIMIGLLAALLVRLQSSSPPIFEITLFLCAIPAFAIGLTEDLTKKMGVKIRLFFTAFAAALVAHFLGVQVTRLDIPGIDFALSFPIIAILFSIFATTGLANAYNIIDGFNGLSSMVGIITLLGLAYVGFVTGDTLIIFLCLVMASSILGFFLWNYPRGLIFLGDGGAYMIGFWIATISMLLIARHPTISPWLALLINAYPIVETLFTIYRRIIHQGKCSGQPDGIHFHTLIYRRILRPNTFKSSGKISANAKTAPYLWLLSSFAVFPAIFFRHCTPILMFFTLVYVILYIYLYKRIVCFKMLKWEF